MECVISGISECVALNCLSLEPARRARLLEAFGNAKKVLDGRGGGAIEADRIVHAREQARKEIDEAQKRSIRIIVEDDDDYPPLLKEIYDRPIVLYVRGQCKLGKLACPISIVGSRNADPYGLTAAESFARALATAGAEIVSGLAYGVDAAAHHGALSARAAGATAATIAVLGSGLLRLYPSEHARLAEKIVAEGGCVISEFPLDAGPQKQNFPIRNRIIAGISHGTLVVQAGQRSGSLITARMAIEYNRFVWALPNRVGEPLSEGIMTLLRSGATPASSAADIIDDISNATGIRAILAAREHRRACSTSLSDTPDKKVAESGDPVLDSVSADGSTIDEIAERCTISREDLLKRLLRLELSGKLSTLPGGLYRVTGT